MNAMLFDEWQAFIRYDGFSGRSPCNVYLTGLVLPAQPCFTSLVAGHAELHVHRSLFVDPFGCGFSDGPENFSYSLDDHAHTVAMLLDHLDLSQCNLIGYSMGGAIAITLASARPDLVASLVLMEANLDPGKGLISSKIAEQTEIEFLQHGYQDLYQLFNNAGTEGDIASAMIAGGIRVAVPHALYRSSVQLAQGTTPTMRERLIQMRIPRIYIYGERSLPVLELADLPRDGIQLLSIPDAGHGMAFENPIGVADALAAAIKVHPTEP
jgi:pimeloyl-ACP methyl ester carboxylesterase